MKLILLLIPCVVFAQNEPIPTPIFLKAGFSSVLEFDDSPTRVVLGDSQSFQVEKLDYSLVVRTLSPYAVSNMFVYFKSNETKLFILKASEDAEPTFYRKFESKITLKRQVLALERASPAKSGPPAKPYKREIKIISKTFDDKKDYLTVEVQLSADSSSRVKPRWDWVRLIYKSNSLKPMKLWAERQDVQKDTKVKARFIFAKPNIPRDFKETSIVIPIYGEEKPFQASMQGRL